MAKVLIKVNVAYPATFIKTYDSQRDIRQNNGEKRYSSGVNEDKHNFVYVISEWKSVESATQFWSSNKAREQIREWECVGSPEIVILRESPED